MPIQHFVDSQTKLLRVRRWGSITTQDEEEACNSRKNDPLVVPGISMLVDCTEVEPTDSTEVVKYLADCTTKIAKELQCGPLAILVSTPVEYGMVRMYMAYTELEHPDTNVFLTEEEALSWLKERGH